MSDTLPISEQENITTVAELRDALASFPVDMPVSCRMGEALMVAVYKHEDGNQRMEVS